MAYIVQVPRSLSPKSGQVLATLVRAADHGKRHAAIKLYALAEDSNVSIPTARAALRDFTRRGWVTPLSTKRGPGGGSEYLVHYDRIKAAQ